MNFGKSRCFTKWNAAVDLGNSRTASDLGVATEIKIAEFIFQVTQTQTSFVVVLSIKVELFSLEIATINPSVAATLTRDEWPLYARSLRAVHVTQLWRAYFSSKGADQGEANAIDQWRSTLWRAFEDFWSSIRDPFVSREGELRDEKPADVVTFAKHTSPRRFRRQAGTLAVPATSSMCFDLHVPAAVSHLQLTPSLPQSPFPIVSMSFQRFSSTVWNVVTHPHIIIIFPCFLTVNFVFIVLYENAWLIMRYAHHVFIQHS